MRVVAGIVAISLFAGCAGSNDREPLTQFLQALEGAVKHSYDEQLRSYAGDERKIRWHALFFRDHVVAIDDYLSKRLPLTERGREAVNAVRHLCVQEAELYEGLLKETRFQLTDTEKERTRELQADYQQKLAVIGRMIDGKD